MNVEPTTELQATVERRVCPPFASVIGSLHRNCVICGSVFQLNPKYAGSRRRIYCSDKCCDIARQCRESGRPPSDWLAQKKCPECGKPVIGKLTKVFCSKRCLSRHNYSTVTIKLCAICSREFRADGYVHTCSDACSKKLRMIGRLTSNFRRGFFTIAKCPRCESHFLKEGSSQKLCQPCIGATAALRSYQSTVKYAIKVGRTPPLPPSDKCRQCNGELDRPGKFCSLCITERTLESSRLCAARGRVYERSILAVRNFYTLLELTKTVTNKPYANTKAQ